MLVPTLIVLYFLNVVSSVPTKPEYDLNNEKTLKNLFNNFKIKHEKIYESSEHDLRFKYFVDNLAKINDMNQKNPLAVFDINKFSDWSPEEIESLRGFSKDFLRNGGDSLCGRGSGGELVHGSAPESVDWREQHAVTEVQTQGHCGACWAFSTTAVVEGAYALKHKQLLDLSKQQLLDCDTSGSMGCYGGAPDSALSYLIQSAGQELESDYKYVEKQQQCTADASKAKVQVTSCKLYINSTESELKEVVGTVGPVAIGLDSGPLDNYQGGILTHCKFSRMDHAVAIVGYGTENGIPFWIIKNSLSKAWGEGGYVRVVRGEGCLGIGQYVVTAEVA